MDYTIGGTGTGFKITVSSKDGKDPDYEKNVVGILGTLEGRTVGKALFNAINNQCSGKTLEIFQRTPASQSLDNVCAATANTKDLSDATKRKAVAKGRSLLGYKPEEDKKQSFYDPEALGSGEGTDSRIGYVPGVWAETEGGVCRAPKSKFGGPGSDPDCILFHELVHSYRIMTGTQLKYRIDVDGNSSQLYEEFVAILVTNIYMSDRKDALLRSFNHQEIAAMQEPDKFMTRYKNRALVEGFCKDLVIAPLLNDLSKVVCTFNPIKDVKAP